MAVPAEGEAGAPGPEWGSGWARCCGSDWRRCEWTLKSWTWESGWGEWEAEAGEDRADGPAAGPCSPG